MNDEFEKIQVVDNKVGVIDPVAYGKGSIFYFYTDDSLIGLIDEVRWVVDDIKDQGIMVQSVKIRKSFVEWCIDNIDPEIFNDVEAFIVEDDEPLDCKAATPIPYEQPLHIGHFLGEVKWGK